MTGRPFVVFLLLKCSSCALTPSIGEVIWKNHVLEGERQVPVRWEEECLGKGRWVGNYGDEVPDEVSRRREDGRAGRMAGQVVS